MAEAFPKEQARLRELWMEYERIGDSGTFGKAVVEQALRNADEAMASGDIVLIVKAYNAMTKCE